MARNDIWTVSALDECGDEVELYRAGEADACHQWLERYRADYPEHSGFRVELLLDGSLYEDSEEAEYRRDMQDQYDAMWG